MMNKEELVYVSQSLKWKNHGKPAFEQLEQILGDRLRVLPVSNEWCRDYMPVRGANGKKVLFKYAPSYLIGDETHERTIPQNLEEGLRKVGIGYETSYELLLESTMIKEVVLDGGGIDILGDVAIVSDRIISDNSTIWNQGRPRVLDDLQNLLGLKKLVVVPADPFDVTGHADGCVRFIDDKTVLINDPTDLLNSFGPDDSIHQLDMYERWVGNFEQTLQDAGFRIEYLPSLMHEEEKPASAWGIYLNFLLLDDLLIVPFYVGKDETNSTIKKQLEELYNRTVYGVYADDLSKEGGVVNCVSWQQHR
jgi:agmatine deiminase